MASKTEIGNMSLLHIGSGKEVANIDTEQSQEATAIRRVYDTALRQTLRDFAWPFATLFYTLELVEEDPNDEYAYSYRYPTNCVDMRRILSGTRNDTRGTRVHYKIGKDDSGLLIFTDEEAAVAEITQFLDDPQFYTADFVMALAWRIAFLIAPQLTAGDPFKMGERALKMYQFEIENAKASALNEEQAEVEPDGEFISGRT